MKIIPYDQNQTPHQSFKDNSDLSLSSESSELHDSLVRLFSLFTKIHIREIKNEMQNDDSKATYS
jgi:hypothetical protein